MFTFANKIKPRRSLYPVMRTILRVVNKLASVFSESIECKSVVIIVDVVAFLQLVLGSGTPLFRRRRASTPPPTTPR